MEKKVDRSKRLGEAPIGKLLMEFSIPAIIAMIANALYNVVDSIFVGRGVGSLALTAVTIVNPIMISMLAFGMLVGIGATAMVSIKLGRGDKNEAEKILGGAVALTVVLGFAFTFIGLLFLDNILVFLGATAEIFNYAKSFMTVILIGSVFQFFSFGMNNIIRAEGFPVTSMLTMLFSSLANTILNPLFIFVFHWGIVGSALATISTQAIISLYILYHFTFGKSHLKLKLDHIKIEGRTAKKIFSIGLSPFLLQLSASVTSLLFNNSLMFYGGAMAVASMGVISRTNLMILMPIFGINQGAQPIIGYNYGAGKFDRVKRALMLASIAATTICVVGFLTVQIFGHQIIATFNNDAELMKIGGVGIRIFMLMIPLVGFQIIITNYFQSVGRAGRAILLSLTRQVLFLIPLILILPNFFGLMGIWVAGPVSDFSASALAAFLFIKERKNLDESHERSLSEA